MTSKQYFVSKTLTLRPSPIILMFLINMVHQIEVGSVGRQKKDKKKLARTFKDTKLKHISVALSRADTVFIVCERICKLKYTKPN